jgi:murein L,D-transpeptidase YafK
MFSKIVVAAMLFSSFAISYENIQSKADLVVVKKSIKKLYLLSDTKIIKEFDIALGANPKGDKEKEGDERTPEGNYTLDYKKSDSSFYKAIHISYPDKNDRKEAKKLGVDPGGFIMIHGQKNHFGWLSFITQKFNWTQGCIALSNDDIDEVWQMVDEGTKIRITP